MKTPGQKAYECATVEMLTARACPWSQLDIGSHAAWERVAVAAKAPEPKSYGQIICELNDEIWAEQGPNTQASWERDAEAVIEEFKRREGIK
jgi:hypothetical protein